MKWTNTEANSLLAIDQEIGKHNLSPAEYEIVRRVIYETADFDYRSHLKFSDRALKVGAGALAARSTIIVDIPAIQVAISEPVQNKFANPIYACVESHSRYDLGTLAKRYPEAIFIIGREQSALSSFFHLVEEEEIKPAFAIITAPKLIKVNTIEKSLESLKIANIRVQGRKGNASVAIAIFKGLIDLAWEVYTQRDTTPPP